MKRRDTRALTALAVVALMAIVLPEQAISHDRGDSSSDKPPARNIQPFPNAAGAAATFNVNGRIDPRNAFFKSLGANGRSCATCHRADQGFSITPPAIRERFERTNGRDPLFAAVDGANCGNIKRSDRAGHSLLLKHGLIRVANAVPATAQFTISVVHDPYGCALVSDPKTSQLVASV